MLKRLYIYCLFVCLFLLLRLNRCTIRFTSWGSKFGEGWNIFDFTPAFPHLQAEDIFLPKTYMKFSGPEARLVGWFVCLFVCLFVCFLVS